MQQYTLQFTNNYRGIVKAPFIPARSDGRLANQMSQFLFMFAIKRPVLFSVVIWEWISLIFGGIS
jgi:uncharacterized membrane protein YhdT